MQDNSRYYIESAADARYCEELSRTMKKPGKQRDVQNIKLKPPRIESLCRRQTNHKPKRIQYSCPSVSNSGDNHLTDKGNNIELRTVQDNFDGADALLSLIKLLEEKYSQNLAVIEQMTDEHSKLETCLNEMEQSLSNC